MIGPPVNLHDESFAIFARLGLEPRLVRSMVIEPREVRVTLYKLNNDGEKYVDLDTGEVATKELLFTIDTTKDTD